jgi:hypothetical protein
MPCAGSILREFVIHRHQETLMKLAETNYDNKETGCCARLDEARWEGQEFVWMDKPFVKDHIWEFLHVPLNFGSVMAREHAALAQAQAYAPEPLWLVDEVSPWGADIYIATDRTVPGMQMQYLSGAFMTKAFSGPYRDIGTWIEQTEKFVRDHGKEVDKLYFFYATCPKCAKHFGKNQVVVFAKVK